MNTLVVVGLAILILPSILILLMPLIDMVLNSSFISLLSDNFKILEDYIGSEGLNIFIIIFLLLLFFIILRHILSYLSSIK